MRSPNLAIATRPALLQVTRSVRVAYLYSRYPVVSQTFCDSEMLALESLGFDLDIASLNRPPDSFRHERLDRLQAPVHYPAPEEVMDARAMGAEFEGQLGPLIRQHEAQYGKKYKAETRARNAWHFAPLLRRRGIRHVHVHFANRATHTALFLKRLGFTFSFTAHAQDFMVDLGSDDLLREMVREAEFVIAVSDFSRQLLAEKCPEHGAKIRRIYNGIELDDFPVADTSRPGPLRIVSVGRLIEFKGFHDLIDAAALAKQRGVDLELRILGEGPWREALEEKIAAHGLAGVVTLCGMASQERIKRELAGAQLFALASKIDSKGASDILPTVITEAMACRLPVLSTKLAGIPEMVWDGVTGRLVEPGGVDALATALQEMAGSPELRRAWGEAGRARAEELFALSRTAGQLGDAFRPYDDGAARPSQAEIVYWIDQSVELPGDAGVDDAAVRFWTGALSETPSEARARIPAQLEFLPDASVLESHWLSSSQARQVVEKARAKIGDALSGEEFYRQARRAVYLWQALLRQGVKHLHAWRSSAVVCVWLVKQLAGGTLKVSAAIEESPALSWAALLRLLPDFDLVSNSEPKLKNEAFLASDLLFLRKEITHREFTLGPLKIKRRAPVQRLDRRHLEAQWLEKIRHLHA